MVSKVWMNILRYKKTTNALDALLLLEFGNESSLLIKKKTYPKDNWLDNTIQYFKKIFLEGYSFVY